MSAIESVKNIHKRRPEIASGISATATNHSYKEKSQHISFTIISGRRPSRRTATLRAFPSTQQASAARSPQLGGPSTFPEVPQLGYPIRKSRARIPTAWACYPCDSFAHFAVERWPARWIFRISAVENRISQRYRVLKFSFECHKK